MPKTVHLMLCLTTCTGNLSWIGTPLYHIFACFHGRCRMEICFSHWTRAELGMIPCTQGCQKDCISKHFQKLSSRKVNQSGKCSGMLEHALIWMAVIESSIFLCKSESHLRKIHNLKKWYTFF